MKKLFRLKSLGLFILTAFFIASCESDGNDIFTIDPTLPGGGDSFDGEISVFDAGGDKRSTVISKSSFSGSEANVKVSFKSDAATMRRLYITSNTDGQGEEPYTFVMSGFEVDSKKDGSIDLTSANGKEFDFQIPLPAPTSATNIVYKLWATTGRGDFRDVTKRNAIGDTETAVGTIIIGDGNVAVNGIKSLPNVKLAAPAGDGTSETFYSIFTAQAFPIKPSQSVTDNGELVEIWDIGYYYGDTRKATLASVFGYNLPGVDIATVSGLSRDEFNVGYFKLSTAFNATDFDTVTISDLDGLSVSTGDAQFLPGLKETDVIEYQDKYGKKGLIRVEQIMPGFAPADDFIIISIKIQA